MIHGGIELCRDPVVDQEGAVAPAVAASEAVASEAADMVAEDSAAVDLAARMVREALILDGDSALALAVGITDPIITVADALAVCWGF